MDALKKSLFGFCALFAVTRILYAHGGSAVDGAVTELRGPPCGTLVCGADEYCNSYSHSCDSCKTICDPDNHNFDGVNCRKQCEVYIYDQRYLQKPRDRDYDDDNLRDTVQNLKLKYTVMLTLLVIVIVVLIVILSFLVWKWKTNNNVTWATVHQKISRKKSDNNTNGVSTNKPSANDQSEKKPDLRLEITSSSVQSEPTPVTMTTGITTRIPAEDSIDYAYDNPAMSNSPKKPGSTMS